MSEEGKKKLRDLAAAVRGKVAPTGENALHQRGLDLVEALAQEVSGPDGMPGLRVWRDSPSKFRLERPNRNATITVEWDRRIGALELTREKHGEPRTLVRYVYDDAGGTKAEGSWRKMEGGGEIYEDLAAALVEALYPEAQS